MRAATLVAMLVVMAAAQSGGVGTFTDSRDRKIYKTAIIGGKRWMAENLNYQPKTGNSWCYENDKSFCDKYGRLYDWKTAMKVCPAGWHLPSRREWDILGRAAGGEKLSGKEYDAVDWYGAGKALKAKSGWSDPADKSGNGTDDYGFSALPGGFRGYYDSAFIAADIDGYWWTATENWSERAYSRNMYYGNGYLNENGFYKNVGLSVRCIQNGGDPKDTLEDKYTVTVSSIGAGAKGGGSYVTGKTVTVTAGTAPGKQFKNWTIASGGVTLADTFKSTTTFTMPANNAAVTANFDTIVVESGTVVDKRDGKTYKTVTIDGKTWMAENLNYMINGSWCYDDRVSNCGKYGRLYAWNTAKTVCHAGWHLPSRWERDHLIEAVGGRDAAGNRLKSKSGWERNNIDNVLGKGTDDYGFSALPGGYRSHIDSLYRYAGTSGYWWTDTDTKKNGDGYPHDLEIHGGVFMYSINEKDGASVRCVQDGSSAAEDKLKMEFEQRKAEKNREIEQEIEKNTTYFADSRDGKKYRAVKIGGRTWMAQNLNYRTSSGSWCYDNDTSNCGKYGKLYNWETAKKVCPSGWYLPSNREWDNLVFAARGDDMCLVGGGWAGTRLKSKNGWRYKGEGFNSTDEFGFSALPGGYRASYKKISSYEDDDSGDVKKTDSGRFIEARNGGYWWTATTDDRFSGGYAKHLGLRYDYFGVSDFANNKDDGLSVRCILGDGGGERSDSARLAKEEEKNRKEEEKKRKEKEQWIKEAKKKEIEAQQQAKLLIAKVSTYFIDPRDGKKYRAVTIGGKRWMAQNLNYATDSSWCYENNADNCKKYGRLYAWETAKRVCPTAWRLPTNQDWNDLITTAENDTSSAGSNLKSTYGWNNVNGMGHLGSIKVSGNGVDNYGFSALPGGAYVFSADSFQEAGEIGYWWTATTDSLGRIYSRGFDNFFNADMTAILDNNFGHSVRCLQDTSGGKPIRREPQKAK